MKTYHKLGKTLDAVRTRLKALQAAPEWLALLQEPSAHPDLPTDLAACLAAARDLQNHLWTSRQAIQQSADRRQALLHETQEEAA